MSDWVVYCRGCGFEIKGDLRRILGKPFCEECYTKITEEIAREGGKAEVTE